MELINHNERFTYNGKDTGLSVLDFWRFEFSNLNDNHGYVAEFLVAKALGKETPDNCVGWTPHDITYNELRIEVKATAYYQPWKEDGRICFNRRFNISQKNKNDIYVFSVLLGENEAEANPMKLENWDFYIIPTKTILELCGLHKSMSLSNIKNITKRVRYDEIKQTIDGLF